NGDSQQPGDPGQPNQPEPQERNAFSVIQAQTFDEMSGIEVEPTEDDSGDENIGYISDGDWVKYANVNFQDGASAVNIRAASDTTGGTIELRTGSPTGSLIGTVEISNTGGWQTWQTFTGNVEVTGVHDLYLVFAGDSNHDLMNVNWFEFTANSN